MGIRGKEGGSLRGRKRAWEIEVGGRGREVEGMRGK
jgi:hypothetical protein